MDLNGYIGLSIKVLTDWRVLACTGAVSIIWALFRYVGVISRRQPRGYARPRAPRPPGPARKPKTEAEGGPSS